MSTNPASITTAFDAELAYRREQVIAHFRPWRRVGGERTVSHAAEGRPGRGGTGSAGNTATAGVPDSIRGASHHR